MTQKTDFRALCAELLDELSGYASANPHHDSDALVARARAALAQPEPEVVGEKPTPGDEELYALWNDCDLGWDEQKGMVVMPHIADFARAVLARWGSCQVILDNSASAPTFAEEVEERVWPPSIAAGCHEAAVSAVSGSPEQQLLAAAGNTIENLWQELHRTIPVQPAPPAEGDAAEVAAWLRAYSDEEFGPHNEDPDTRWFARAADLLEQRHPAPVPVAERLPGPEDCDAEGRCWVHQPHEACPESPAWELMLAKYASPNYGATCWLPATALPLPQGEVE